MDTDKILNTAAGFLAGNQGRNWQRVIIVTESTPLKEIAVGKLQVRVPSYLIGAYPNPVDLINRIFLLCDHFDAVEEREKNRAVEEYSATFLRAATWLQKNHPEKLRGLIEDVLHVTVANGQYLVMEVRDIFLADSEAESEDEPEEEEVEEEEEDRELTAEDIADMRADHYYDQAVDRELERRYEN